MSGLQAVIDAKTREIISKVSEDIAGMYIKYRLDLDQVCKFNKIALLEGSFNDDKYSGTIIKEGVKLKCAYKGFFP